jgi:5-formyltetrahydrofolate cyclo-ligase
MVHGKLDRITANYIGGCPEAPVENSLLPLAVMSSSSINAGDPPSGAALRDAKIALRRDVLAKRDELAPEQRAAAAVAIANRIAAMPSFAQSRTVLLTLAFRSEWDTLPLVRSALAAGKTVALPRVDDARRMLELHALADPVADIVPGFRGIPEPRADAPTVSPASVDWVLVPGVAFDRDGRRVGYGGGYYDRLLPLLRPRIPRVAGAYDVQVVAHVPSSAHDLTVDAIVTETQTIVAGGR